MAAFIFIVFFARTIEVLLAGQILCGIPWGVFATIGISYASEIVPLQLRGYLTAIINLYWATGQFVAAGVLQGLVNTQTKYSYKIPYALQWMWVVPLFILTLFAPDSPYYLIRKGRFEDAEKSIRRLSSKRIAHTAKDRLALMIYTNSLEREHDRINNEESGGWKGYIQCFKGVNLRRTEIMCLSLAGQVLAGSTFAYSPSYFFSQAGLNSKNTYKLNLGTTGIAWSGTVCSWFLLSRFGRRTIYVTGYFFLVLFLFLIGILARPAENNSAVKWAQAAITMLWVSTYALTIGPLAFTITAETSATRIRSQSIALARNAYNIASLVSNVVEPYLLNPNEADLKGKTAFIWFATAFPTLIWCYFRLPETKDRTYEELDLLFEKKIPARQFASYDLDSDMKNKNNKL
ncbi:maltose permease [Scheffersomyces amazonensis]|uniref:maltose permease n=1 Tax=Scheffersomyces amazonensis TaxID=1078765 RepID=UPI00315CA265